jgi:hypothetical protein
VGILLHLSFGSSGGPAPAVRLFDTGLFAPQRTLLQNKVIELLQPLKLLSLGGTDAGGFLRAIIPISFRVTADDPDTIDMLETAVGSRTPAIAVAVLDLHPQQAGGPGRSSGELELHLYFLTAHHRDKTEGRARGDVLSAVDLKADPGVYAIVELAWALLFDVPLGIKTLHELKLRFEGEVLTSERLALWRQEWRILVGRDANMYRGITERLTRAVTTLDSTDDLPAEKNLVIDTTIP